SGGARHYAFAVLDPRLDFHPAAVRDARLHVTDLDLAVMNDVEPRVVAVLFKRGRWNAETLAPGKLDLAGGEGANMGARRVVKRDPDLARAAPFVHFLVHQPDVTHDPAVDAG